MPPSGGPKIHPSPLHDCARLIRVAANFGAPSTVVYGFAMVSNYNSKPLAAEELRLRHRHLDLRRPELRDNIMLRHRLMQASRRFLSDDVFVEIETPILTKPAQAGARDYLVPSRVHAGEFYALPQSP